LPKGSNICARRKHVVAQNTLSELRRHLARLRFVRDQIRAVEQDACASSRGSCAETKSPDAMVRLIARVFGAGIETADMLVNEIFSRQCAIASVARYAVLLARPTRAAAVDANGVLRALAMSASAAHDSAGLAFCQVQKNST